MFNSKLSSLEARIAKLENLLTKKASVDSDLSVILSKALHNDGSTFFHKTFMKYNGVDKFMDDKNDLWIKIIWKKEGVNILWNMNGVKGRPNFKSLASSVVDPANPTPFEIERAVESVNEYYRRFIRAFHSF